MRVSLNWPITTLCNQNNSATGRNVLLARHWRCYSGSRTEEMCSTHQAKAVHWHKTLPEMAQKENYSQHYFMLQTTVFSDVTPFSLVHNYLRFGEICCLHFLSQLLLFQQFIWYHILQDRNLHIHYFQNLKSHVIPCRLIISTQSHIKTWMPHFTFTNVYVGSRHLSHISLDSHSIRVYKYSWISLSLPKQEETAT
jgi:hypothetical protein